MKRALIACLAAVLLSAPASARKIGNDPGGYLPTYWKHVEAFRASGEMIMFDGTCASACTLLLSLPAKQLCATGRVQFWFHKPFGGRNSADDKHNERFVMGVYPKWVRDWIDDHGGLKKEMMMMDRYVVREHMKTCKTENAAN